MARLIRKGGMSVAEAKSYLIDLLLGADARISVGKDREFQIRYLRIYSRRGVSPDQVQEVLGELQSTGTWWTLAGLANHTKIQPIHVKEALHVLTTLDLVAKRRSDTGDMFAFIQGASQWKPSTSETAP